MRAATNEIISHYVLSLQTRRRGRLSQEAQQAYLGCFLISLALFGSPAFGQNHEAKTPLVLQGKLLSVSGTAPILRASGKDYSLAGKTPYLFHTLQDERLLNREVRLEGRMRPDGVMEVTRLYTLRDGKLYKVRYYCEVCNIEALEPGPCVCCQKPTDLQEIPITEGNQ